MKRSFAYLCLLLDEASSSSERMKLLLSGAQPVRKKVGKRDG